MTGLIWRAAAVSVAIAALAVYAALQVTSPRTVPSPIISGVCVLLIVIAVLDWWAVRVVRRALQRATRRSDLAVGPLQDQYERFVLTAAGCTAIAVVGFNYLVGSLLPKGAGFLLLAVGLLLVSVPPVVFLYRYYRTR